MINPLWFQFIAVTVLFSLSFFACFKLLSIIAEHNDRC